jgi:hypothetical protein
MPAFKQHLCINLVALSAVEIARQLIELEKDPEARFDLGRLALNVSVGSLAGALPDLIEPSLGNPNHRGCFHSVAAAILVWWLASGRHTDELPVDVRHLLEALALGYTLHLGADLFCSKAKGMGFVCADL